MHTKGNQSKGKPENIFTLIRNDSHKHEWLNLVIVAMWPSRTPACMMWETRAHLTHHKCHAAVSLQDLFPSPAFQPNTRSEIKKESTQNTGNDTRATSWRNWQRYVHWRCERLQQIRLSSHANILHNMFACFFLTTDTPQPTLKKLHGLKSLINLGVASLRFLRSSMRNSLHLEPVASPFDRNTSIFLLTFSNGIVLIAADL